MSKLLERVCIVCLLLFQGCVTKALDTPKDAVLISVDFEEVELRQALQILAKFAGFNLVIDSSVHGKVSLHLSQVPAEEALTAILELHGLAQKHTGNTRSIRPRSVAAERLEAPPLESKRIIVQNRSAKEVATLFLEGQLHKTPGSNLSIDTRSNSLWIRDTGDRIKALENLVSSFDYAVQQVLIEARIVSVNRNLDHALGVRFKLKPSIQSITTPAEQPDAVNGEQEDTLSSFSFDLTNCFGLNRYTVGPFLWKGFNQLLDLELAAMESEGHGRIIASPHLITTDKTSASIETGSEIPYQEKGRYGTSVAFKKAVLSLQVRPEVTPSKQILLTLEVHHDKPGVASIEQTPAIDTQKLKTQVLVKGGETVALGGIYETIAHQGTYRIPGLGKVPLIGWLFTQKNQINITRELVIFVTPHLVSDQLLEERKIVSAL